MKQRDDHLNRIRERISEIAVEQVAARQGEGALLIDVREPDEWTQGFPEGAVCLSRSFLELRIEEKTENLTQPILLICQVGTRSLLAADTLQQLGYSQVHSVRGGFEAWKQAGLPLAESTGLDASRRQRYDRHLRIPEVGEAGQQKLLQSKVLLIGAGGLGSPAALYLTAAGVGTIGIVDDDIVDRSNLQRQILHQDGRVGRPKVESARTTLLDLNPDIEVRTYGERLTKNNIEEVFSGYQVIVDGSDNFATRYLVNDACVHLGIPNVHGSILGFEGQVSVFWPQYAKRRGPCYRCLFPEPPPPELAPSCAEAGVLGALPGIIGTLEAIETLKLLLELGDPLVGRLLVYDALGASFYELKQKPNAECAYCAAGAPFPGYQDYEDFCKS